MNRVKHIGIDLKTYKIILQFQNSKNPLILHFDTPSRKFYLSLIALIVHEMKLPGHSGYVYIRKHETLLKFLDDALAESNASGTVDGMWEKIRKAWHYSLPNLEEASNFKIEGRDQVAPYEKGGKYLYECTEDECDIWASLFGIDEIANKWRYRFAVDEAWLGLSDVTLKFGDLRDDSAWDAFLRQLEEASTKTLLDTDSDSAKPVAKTYPIRWQLLAMAVVVLFVLLIGGAAILNRYMRPAPPPTESVEAIKPSIAVLPFINVSDDPDKDYFCDGITEELINSLAKVKDLRVISRTSAFYFKDKGFDLRTIGEKLGVDNILEGSVRVSGDKLKISAQLIKVADDSHLWADSYDRKAIDIFDTQENIAQEISCSLKSRLGCESGKSLTKKYTENIEAHNLYLKGRFLSTPRSYSEAIDNFNQAITLDPNYALAYVGLADAYNEMAFHFPASVKQLTTKAREAAEKAIEIDENLAESYAALGFLILRYEWNWKDAEQYLKKAVDLNPGNALSRRKYSSFLRAIGRIDESLFEIKEALKLDPISPIVNAQFGLTLQCQGRLEESIKQHQETVEMYPNHPIVLVWYGSALIESGRVDEAISLMKKAVNITKRKAPFALGSLGYAYGISGRLSEAQEILNEFLLRSETEYIPPTFIARVYMGLNDMDKSFEWLELAYEQKDPLAYPIKTMPNFGRISSDPRWSALMKKMGLEG